MTLLVEKLSSEFLLDNLKEQEKIKISNCRLLIQVINIVQSDRL